MKILALEKDIQSIPNGLRETMLRDEAHAVWQLQQRGVIREIYFHKDRPQAILMLECANVEEARTTLGFLPLVKNTYTDFELLPLVPYPGLARLFAPGNR
ncbi:MAG: superoxide dismutase [Bacteroidetes bacterium]|nr:superoxide dismutase [Bacteroidota bacterium]